MIAANHHQLDLNESEELDLFAEEIPGQGKQNSVPSNTYSTVACECELSTFFCYGSGL